ncbi:MAG: hypothetical protein HY960_03950 [Ignavibacteriae bacterium]|nr:hypothetical protein [Ignavibacteriota bacterium]
MRLYLISGFLAFCSFLLISLMLKASFSTLTQNSTSNEKSNGKKPGRG